MLHQRQQQVELAARQVHQRAVRRVEAAPPGIQRPALELERPGRVSLRPPPHVRRTAQHGADAGQQLARVERLGEIVVGAHLQPDDPVRVLADGGEHDDRQV